MPGKLSPLLRLAALNGAIPALRVHILRGDDLNACDSSGATPLMLAAARGRAEAVREILAAAANPALRDSRGMNALDHARLSGSAETVLLLESPLPDSGRDDGEAYASDKDLPANGVNCSPLVAGGIDKVERDDSLSMEPADDGWEAEEEAKVPEGDNSVEKAVRETHVAIGRHRAIDTCTGWDDVDLFLPDHVMLLPAEFAEGDIQGILLAAIHDGMVTEQALLASCLRPDGERDLDAERRLTLVITEAGGTVVDWIDDSEAYCTNPIDTEIHELAEVMEFASGLLDGYNEPFRFYSRDMRGNLLTADQEVVLGQRVEQAGRDAARALALWPAGLELLFNAAWRVARGLAKAEFFCEMTDLPENPDSGEKNSAFVHGGSASGESDYEGDYPENEESVRPGVLNYFLSAVHAIQDSEGDKNCMTELLSGLKLSKDFMAILEKAALSDEKSGEFIAALERRSAAIGELVVRNLRLAFDIAKKYRWSGLPLDDLIQDANLGLITAAGHYDWRKGFRFSTYATWWIRQAVTRGIADKSMIVRAPVHVQEKARVVLRGIREAEVVLGRPEREHETRERTGLDYSRLQLILSLFNESVSLDETDPETGNNRIDDIAGPRIAEPQYVADQNALHQVLMEILLEMDAREREGVMLRFGLDGEDPMTLEEVGQNYGVTRERIRQIEAKAMRRLRYTRIKDVLAPFLE